ncbi:MULTISPECIES: hypothetical protein [unclassified Pseudoxanthomonas]|uniref:hypothetical protein n=1 Tax=unclassified Pseudoxanthomonas TaxID=2645906 RepID=UPI00307E16FC
MVVIQEVVSLPPGVLEWLTAIGSLLAGIGTLGLMWAARAGLNSWRLEAKSKRAMQLGEEILALSYECFEAIEYMRMDFPLASELAALEQEPTESVEEFHSRRHIAPVIGRYQKASEKISRLLAMRFRAAALFSEEHGRVLQTIPKLANDVLQVANDLDQQRRNLAKHPNLAVERPDMYQAWLSRLFTLDDALWWRPYQENNQLNLQADIAKKKIEALYKPIVSDGTYSDR